MQPKMPGLVDDDGARHDAIHEAECTADAEWTLRAIARAIAVGDLPPDDAFAWARIAVYEAGPRTGRGRRGGCRSPATHVY
jgi:hypothetical protein